MAANAVAACVEDQAGTTDAPDDAEDKAEPFHVPCFRKSAQLKKASGKESRDECPRGFIFRHGFVTARQRKVPSITHSMPESKARIGIQPVVSEKSALRRRDVTIPGRTFFGSV